MTYSADTQFATEGQILNIILVEEGSLLHSHRRENLKSYIILVSYSYTAF
jgi:hypothetical protein